MLAGAWLRFYDPAMSGVDGVSPPGSGDDIPLARRSRARSARGPSIIGTLAWILVCAGGMAVLVLALRGPLSQLVAPFPVAGLNARPDRQGRLLGHFPYPEAPASRLQNLGPGLQLRPEAAQSFLAMRRAAAADGVDLMLLSAFRSLSVQQQLFFDVMSERNQSARQRAQVSAPPGFSEHSTGFAIDLGDRQRPATHLSTSFESTPAFRWLQANAGRFHFHLSFPEGNAQGVNYEPWHWRYEGSTEALRLFEPALALGR